MSYNDGISDLLTRIRNGYLVGLLYVKVRKSKINSSILNVLKDEGYIVDFKEDSEKDNHINVLLRYKNGKPAINDLKRISKPGKRVYSSIKKMKKYYNGFATVVISCSRGILADYKASEINTGGEILFYVF